MKRWAARLEEATRLGRKAGNNPAATLGNNPYKTYEYRKSWAFGFNARRTELATTGVQLRLPYKDD